MDNTFKLGSRLFAIHDTKLKGFITWMEKGQSAIFLFTTSDKAEHYVEKVRRNRPIVVYPIEKRKAEAFIHQMLNAGINYALVDVPPEHADTYNVHDDEVVRNYALIDLRLARARMS